MHLTAFRLARNSMVLKELTINPNGPEYVRIVARRQGFWGWLLSALGIDTTTVLEVFANRVSCSAGSLSGRFDRVMPLSALSTVGTGFFKPVLYLVLALVGLLGGIVWTIVALSVSSPRYGYGGYYGDDTTQMVLLGVLCIVLGLFCLLRYVWRKTLVLYFQPHSGDALALSVKRSLIEGVSLDAQKASEIVAIVTDLIAAQTDRTSGP